MTRHFPYQIQRRCVVFVFLAIFTALACAQAPVPLITLPLVPDAAAPGGAPFTVTVNGTGFVSGSVVNWNGSPRSTTFVSSSNLTVEILDADIATARTGSVTVVNPTPGGGTSNVAFFMVTPNTGSSVTFSPVSVPTGGCPTSVAVGDFNGDGKLDLATTDFCSDAVLVLLGDGIGNFTLASSPATGHGPQSLTVGDFNGDGKMDLAVVNYYDFTVSVLLGDGKGNFTLISSPITGRYPYSVAAGDFNGDGKQDLAVTNSSGNTVSILLGDGVGDFTLASSPATGTNPVLAAVGDFNKDGNLDLAVVNNFDGTISILLGDGAGNFAIASSPATGSNPVSMAVGDFNGDGKLDLAVANSINNFGDSISILLGDGTGNFTLASSPFTDTSPYSIAVGDFNGDSILDLAAPNGDGTVSILLGDGKANFNLASSPATGANGPFGVAVGDFNGDGRLDVAITDYSHGVFSLLNYSGPQASTTTALASSPNPSVYGQTVSFTAKVTSSAGTPAGTVALSYLSQPIGSGTLVAGKTSISVFFQLPAGQQSVNAAYQGGFGFAPSNSALTQTVSRATTATSLVSSINPAVTNQPITYTATVTSQYGGEATGSVAFLAEGQILGTASLSGNQASLATSFPAAGTYSISAQYRSDANNRGSTSSVLKQVVNSTTKSATSTTLVSSLNPSLYGQKVTWTATVVTSGALPPAGTVTLTWKYFTETFTIGSATLNGSGVATFTKSNLNADTLPLTAVYKGDTNNLSSTSAVLNQVVTQTTSAASIVSSVNPSTSGQAVIFTAKITSPTVTPTGPVTFSAGKTVLGTAQLSGGKAALSISSLPVGSTKVTVTYAGDSNIAKSSASVTQIVQP